MSDKLVIGSFKITKDSPSNGLNFSYTGEAGYLKFSKPRIGQYTTWGATQFPYSNTAINDTSVTLFVGGFQITNEDGIVKVDGPTKITAYWHINDPFGNWPANLDWCEVEPISVDYFPDSSKSEIGPVVIQNYTKQITNSPKGLS